MTSRSMGGQGMTLSYDVQGYRLPRHGELLPVADSLLADLFGLVVFVEAPDFGVTRRLEVRQGKRGSLFGGSRINYDERQCSVVSQRGGDRHGKYAGRCRYELRS